MATANTKSTIITNLDAAAPKTMTPSALRGSIVRMDQALLSVAAADDDGSVYRITRINLHRRILDVRIRNTAITSGTVYTLGLYQTAANGGAVVSADLFTTTIDMSSARTSWTSVTPYLTNQPIAEHDKYLWEQAAVQTALSITADNGKEYDMCFTASTVGSAAGSILVQVLWTE